MLIATLAALAALFAVVAATHHRGAALDPPQGPEPDWDPLPAPNDVARPDFPLAFPGYDPATVEATVEALLVAYEELYTAAGPDARARARRAAARRRGRLASEPTREARSDTPEQGPWADPPDLDEALRTAAALAAISRAEP